MLARIPDMNIIDRKGQTGTTCRIHAKNKV